MNVLVESFDTILFISSLILVIVAVINVLFGLIVFFNRDHFDQLSRVFMLLAFNVSLWTLCIVFYRLTTSQEQAQQLLKILYFIPVFIPVLFVDFAKVYTKSIGIIGHSKIITTSIWLVAAIIAVLALLSNAFVQTVLIPDKGEKIILFGPFFAIYVLFFMATFSWGYALLLRQIIRVSDHLQRKQTMYLFLGTFTSSGVAMVTNLLMPWFGYFELNWFGNAATILFVGFIFYAIVRHHLFNLKVISTELLTFGLWLVMLFQVFSAQTFIQQSINVASLTFSIILGIFIIRSVQKEMQSREKLELVARELERANAQLRSLDEQKTEFISVASHQLRAPIAAIRGYTSLLLEGSFGAISAGAKQALERISYSGKAMADMVEDFLNISRIEQGRMKYTMKPFEFHAMLRRVVDSMQQAATTKQLTLTFSVFPPDATFTVHGDEEKLAQVFSNLIDNALKYTPQGTVEVQLAHSHQVRKLHVSIHDNGIGISKEDQTQLFQKFIRGDNANNVNVHGTGLGLYVAKELLRAHNGRIWVESQGVGKGSTFHVELNILN